MTQYADTKRPNMFQKGAPWVFPTEAALSQLVEELSHTCEGLEAEDQPYSQVVVQEYRQQLLDTAPHEASLAHGCALHSLLLHCPVQQALPATASQATPRPARAARAVLQAGHESAARSPAALQQQRSSGSALRGWLDFMTPGRAAQGAMQMAKHAPTEVRETVERGLRQDISSSPDMLKQATRHWGQPAGLQGVFRKLMQGELVRVVAIGGSVTTGMGARNLTEAYPYRIVQWLRSLGTDERPAKVEFVNSAVSATTSSYTSQCMHDFVPADADLVLVEFSVNDWEVVDAQNFAWMDNSLRRGFERLIRKLLGMDSSPAVLLLHWWAPLHFKSSFWNVAEDELDTIGSYYDLQSISYRNAMYKLIMADQPGFRLEEIMCDIVHPNPLGHRYFADLVIGYMQQVLADMLLESALPAASAHRLPPPLFSGNEVQGDAICLKGEDLKGAVVKLTGSWKWVNEAKQGSKQPKWGYTSSSVGDALTLRVSRSKAAAPLLGFGGGNSTVLVGLGVLRSYKGMGAAAVACTQGCTCSPQVFELQHKQQVSQVYWVYLLVSLLSKADCHMTVTVAESADRENGGTKVKVTSLMVSEDERAESTNVFTVLNSTDAEGNNSGKR
ncbi:g6531 [Coccomyxa viridis]|uniref:G6531 protein n=1 Tax=Coccomyxa viridis TaxID=1274662 RepID=A0ABP1FVK7_9CHLO